MALRFETFDNRRGGSTAFKALGHPLACAPLAELIAGLEDAPLTVFDPEGLLGVVAELYDLSALDVRGVCVQRIEDLGRSPLGHPVRPLTELSTPARDERVLIAAFDAARYERQVRALVPEATRVVTLDAARIPERMLTNPRRYLDPLNFATNFALLREGGGRHTRVTLCDYWSGYGAPAPRVWFRLFDAAGEVLADWEETPPAPGGTLVIDSAAVRRRFGLGEFTGSLFIHAAGIAGHDVIKYALDTWSDDGTEFSCTHDANAWPADRYAGLPAPDADETVLLWIQNSHPAPIPAGAVGIAVMGSEEVRTLDCALGPFATAALDVGELFPQVRWPAQFEVHAGRHFVRPRYEVRDRTRVRIAHANVERTDLEPDPRLPELGRWLGRGYLLPAPLLPLAQWQTLVLPTPMSTAQAELPLAIAVRDASGAEVLCRPLGRLPRGGCPELDLDALLAEAGATPPAGYGHLELFYDFGAGGAADGWLHALFRYRRRDNGHAAESSFGAHVYNVPVTYRNEPQSYAGPPPGLSTRLFLRLGDGATDTLCQLIYPLSIPPFGTERRVWHAESDTRLLLHDARGGKVAERHLKIPAGGSRLWRYHELFDAAARARAGVGAYVLVRDTTCRLFGYHGLLGAGGVFSLDHMFGF